MWKENMVGNVPDEQFVFEVIVDVFSKEPNQL